MRKVNWVARYNRNTWAHNFREAPLEWGTIFRAYHGKRRRKFKIVPIVGGIKR